MLPCTGCSPCFWVKGLLARPHNHVPIMDYIVPCAPTPLSVTEKHLVTGQNKFKQTVYCFVNFSLLWWMFLSHKCHITGCLETSLCLTHLHHALCITSLCLHCSASFIFSPSQTSCVVSGQLFMASMCGWSARFLVGVAKYTNFVGHKIKDCCEEIEFW